MAKGQKRGNREIKKPKTKTAKKSVVGSAALRDLTQVRTPPPKSGGK